MVLRAALLATGAAAATGVIPGFAPEARAQTSLGPGFSYQGTVTNAGVPMNGSVTMVLSLWRHPTSTLVTDRIGSEQTISPNPILINGLFEVTANKNNEFTDAAFTSSDDRWIQMKVNGSVILTRVQIRGVPYALGLRLPLTETVAKPNSLLKITNTDPLGPTGRTAALHGVRGGPATNSLAGLFDPAILGESNTGNGVVGVVSKNSAAGVMGISSGVNSAGVSGRASGDNAWAFNGSGTNGLLLAVTTDHGVGADITVTGQLTRGIRNNVSGANSLGIEVTQAGADSVGVDIGASGDRAIGLRVASALGLGPHKSLVATVGYDANDLAAEFNGPTVVLGNAGAEARFGIGTSSPAAPLVVVGGGGIYPATELRVSPGLNNAPGLIVFDTYTSVYNTGWFQFNRPAIFGGMVTTFNQNTNSNAWGTGARLSGVSPRLVLEDDETEFAGFAGCAQGVIHLGLHNFTDTASGAIPSHNFRSLFAIDAEGRVGSMFPPAGSLAVSYRNLLDDGAGRAAFSGDVAVDSYDQAGPNSARGLRFGGGGSGELIASNRTDGGPDKNRYGLDFYTHSINRLSITLNGDVGIGVTAPKLKLEVAGTISCYSIVQGSSIRYKDHVRPIEDALARVLKLDGVRFDWKPEWAKERPGREHDIGFVAEDVAKVFPEVVFRDAEGNVTGMDYSRLTAVAVQAIKQQNARVEDQHQKIEALRAENQALKDRLDRLEMLMRAARVESK